MEAKNNTTASDSSTNIFLTGAILFANLDFPSLADYALKAAIGGMIWMILKLSSDYLSEKIKNRKQK